MKKYSLRIRVDGVEAKSLKGAIEWIHRVYVEQWKDGMSINFPYEITILHENMNEKKVNKKK